MILFSAKIWTYGTKIKRPQYSLRESSRLENNISDIISCYCVCFIDIFDTNAN